jgi:hypothetical protein
MIEKLSEIESLTGYAHGIMRHKCSQRIQQKQKTKELIVPSKPDEANDDIDDIQSDQPTPLDRLVQDEGVNEAFGLMQEFFDRKPKHWEIIRLKLFINYPTRRLQCS